VSSPHAAGGIVRPPTETSFKRAWAAVVVLAVVGLLSYIDRLPPGFLAEPIKRDLQLSARTATGCSKATSYVSHGGQVAVLLWKGEVAKITPLIRCCVGSRYAAAGSASATSNLAKHRSDT
jgi:hypothetical protein